MALALKAKELPVKGMLPASMLDWDGKLAAVLFLGGCNFRCPFCHNGDLVEKNSDRYSLSWDQIYEHLVTKKEWLDGVVVTGGEPTIHKELFDLLRQIKLLGLAVKLDTNGALPGALVNIIKEELVDYIAMDVKTSFAKYKLAASAEVDPEIIKKSTDVIRRAGVDYEFRTTVVPGIVNPEDVLEIAEFLDGANAYYLQQYNSSQVLEPQAFIPRASRISGTSRTLRMSKTSNITKVRGSSKNIFLKDVKPYLNEELEHMARECSKFVPTKVRTY